MSVPTAEAKRAGVDNGVSAARASAKGGLERFFFCKRAWNDAIASLSADSNVQRSHLVAVLDGSARA